LQPNAAFSLPAHQATKQPLRSYTLQRIEKQAPIIQLLQGLLQFVWPEARLSTFIGIGSSGHKQRKVLVCGRGISVAKRARAARRMAIRGTLAKSLSWLGLQVARFAVLAYQLRMVKEREAARLRAA
jgi:hypothetical protein